MGIQRRDGEPILNPSGTTLFQEEDLVVLLGLPEQLTVAEAFFRTNGK